MRHNAAIFIENRQREILPAQVRDPSMAPLQPEKRLMLAVLENAINDFQTYAIVPTGRGRGLFMEVAAWFRSSATGIFDFEGICQATGLDPDYIREGLRRWHDSQRPYPASNMVARTAKTGVVLVISDVYGPLSSGSRGERRLDATVDYISLAAERVARRARAHRQAG
jgi:hypothetical protein